MPHPLDSEEMFKALQGALDANPERPWCVHRLYEEVLVPAGSLGDRDRLLEQTERAANALVAAGRARHEAVSALAIGVHCQDTVYWSTRSPYERLEEFGPEYESPTILRRLASHMRCHGL
ncbi:MAG: hypothetical protein L3J72_00595 [Thermoplasmata archaeon]|nr:hypothetical protein [Thermoplasmata archaeon]MCI4341669.1 hypothetical protein [Thermoplasmata archaeon]